MTISCSSAGSRGRTATRAGDREPRDRFPGGAVPGRAQVLLVGPAERTCRGRIARVRFHQGRPIVALEGVETMNDAEALAGAEL